MKIKVLLKHAFVPHDKNDYKPHLLREIGVSVLLFISLFLLGSSMGSSFFIHRTVLGASVASSVLIDMTNESRLALNESPLIRSDKLDHAAELKGADMSSKQYFSHNSPEGVTPWHWFKEVGYNFLYAGENLAINFTDSADVEAAWLNSPTHRANIMNVEFREIGMATVKGMYKDYPTIYVVQMFGTPAYSYTKRTVDEKAVAVVPLKKATTTVEVKKLALLPPPPNASTTEPKKIVGDVKGAEATTASSSLEPIVTTQEMAIVKNTDQVKTPARVLGVTKTYSTWYERMIFKAPFYVDVIYKVLMIIVSFTLVTMILIEIRKQHYKHIIMGICLLLMLSLFIYINQAIF